MIFRRIAILIALTMVFSGCVKDEAASGFAYNNELAINTTLDGMPITQTRGASTDADLKTYGFYLAGYHTEGLMEAAAADAYPNVFNHDAQDAQPPVPLVKLVSNKFTLKTIKWALDETTHLSFFGWSQSKAFQPEGGVGLYNGDYRANDKLYGLGLPVDRHPQCRRSWGANGRCRQPLA